MTSAAEPWRFERRGPAGHEIPLIIVGGRPYDLRVLTDDITPAFLETDGIARAHRAALSGELLEIEVEGMRYGPPVTGSRAVVCIGQNYAAHAAETGDAPPTSPIVFFKHPQTIVGPHDSIPFPPGEDRVDWEVELAIVIGKTARHLSTLDEARDAIAGFTISDDLSGRYHQTVVSGGQWSKGKSFDSFNPLGPWLVPAEALGTDVQSLGLRSWVNGQPRQDSNTSDMIFSVAEIVKDLSGFMVLGPGDIINTGTPQGVAASGRFPFLLPGDTVRVEVDRLGWQSHTFAEVSR
jgi:2-keto-4-pentenoate hydratase/2-oxohepta-3-ene-1,7-dioic acid hydratase in catechol pathway